MARFPLRRKEPRWQKLPPPAAGPDIDAFARAVDPHLLDEQQFVQLVDLLDMLGRVGTGIDLAGMRTETFVWFLSRASRTQLEELMAHPRLRHVVFAEVFRRMTDHVDAERAATLRAVVHWRFSGGSGEGGYDRFQTVFEDGVCYSGDYPTEDARVTLTVAPVDFLRVICGGVGVPMLFLSGRVKVKGDYAFAAGLVGYFDLPKLG